MCISIKSNRFSYALFPTFVYGTICALLQTFCEISEDIIVHFSACASFFSIHLV